MKRELEFYGLLDFFPRKQEIKDNFDMLTIDERIQYKMYVYSIPFEEEYIKDLMWEYLNGWYEGMFLLGKHYSKKKKKNEKRQQEYDLENQENVEFY